MLGSMTPTIVRENGRLMVVGLGFYIVTSIDRDIECLRI
jgi:hypothetical protein